jgi:hypothetical protein
MADGMISICATVATIVVFSSRISVSVGRPASKNAFSVLHIANTLSAIVTPLWCTGSIVFSADFDADPYTVSQFLSVDKKTIWCNLGSVFWSLPHFFMGQGSWEVRFFTCTRFYGLQVFFSVQFFIENQAQCFAALSAVSFPLMLTCADTHISFRFKPYSAIRSFSTIFFAISSSESLFLGHNVTERISHYNAFIHSPFSCDLYCLYAPPH